MSTTNYNVGTQTAPSRDSAYQQDVQQHGRQGLQFGCCAPNVKYLSPELGTALLTKDFDMHVRCPANSEKMRGHCRLHYSRSLILSLYLSRAMTQKPPFEPPKAAENLSLSDTLSPMQAQSWLK